ncbi:MAG: lipid-binding SYLF domain-containing protein [Acidobacteriota bacterium]|jgi:SH3 domain-containing YSC84-like protein 1
MTMKRNLLFLLLLGFLLTAALPAAAAEDKTAEANATVKAAETTLSNFLHDPNMHWLKAHFQDAKGILIIPDRNKGGFIFAGSGGVGVLMAKLPDGRWSQPAFYKLGSVSVGLQIGGEHSEVILFIRSKKGLDSFLQSSVKLGGEASVAAGPVGEGTQAATADILSFSRTKGAFVGAALAGTVVKTGTTLNEAFYGKYVTPVDILVRAGVRNPKADALRQALYEATR